MLHPKMTKYYIGVDTHKRTHTAVVINCFSEVLGNFHFENKPGAFEEFLSEVKKLTPKGIKPTFGLEDTGGVGRPLTAFLLTKKHTVKKVDSSLSYSERRNQSIIHKTDLYDAECVARVLLNKFDTLPDAQIHDIYWTLGMLVGRRNAIVKSNTALKNQIHAQIMHHYPSYRKFFRVFDSKTAMAFWEKYPSPSKLKDIHVSELADLLNENSKGFYSLEKAKEIMKMVKNDGDTTSEFQSSRDFMVSTCIRQLRQNKEEIDNIEGEIRVIMDKLGFKLETMIGLDLATAAYMISEIGDVNRFANADKLSKYSGIAPVTYSSGDKNRTFKNRYGNRRLYQLFRGLAARQINPGRNKAKPANAIFFEYYNKKISERKTKQQALICIMRRLVGIVYGMLKNKTAYVHPLEKIKI